MCDGILILLLAGLVAVSGDEPNCYGKKCTADEYCSSFNDKCESCAELCDEKSHNSHSKDCQRLCSGYSKDSYNVEAELKAIKIRQMAMITLLIIIILLVSIIICRYSYLFYKWLKKTKRWSNIRNNLVSTNNEAKSTEINQLPTLHIPEVGRPPSQIYSVTGKDDFEGVEGSTILTVTTPVSTRYPAEDNTAVYSYDNAALQVTPVSEKPSGASDVTLPVR